MSGGIDSTALAAICRPAAGLFIDYGQRPASAERRASAALAEALDLELHQVSLDMRQLGGGLLLNEIVQPGAPSPEWWPYRNQILVTAGAAIAIRLGLERVIVGTVAGDGERHADGTAEFLHALNALLGLQEGNISVIAPALSETSEELVTRSGLDESLLGWTVSCHRSELPCGDCPGCWKRGRVMDALCLLQPAFRPEHP
jgi:7-cyano-7-deazaguanine synthase